MSISKMVYNILKISRMIMVFCIVTACVQTQPSDLQDAKLNNVASAPADESGPADSSKSKKTKTSMGQQPSSELSLPKAIAILPFKNHSDEPAASQILRSTLFGHIASSNYRFLHLKDVDNRLAILDPNQQISVQDAGLLTNLLDVDGLMFAEILRYETLYVGIYAQITFEVKVTLINQQGEIIWQEQFEEVSREGGISNNTLAMLYNIAVAALHLSDENLLAVADKLGRNIAKKMPQPEQYRQVAGSFIDSVLHDGKDKVLKYGNVLQVGIKGEANKLASVTLEGIKQIFSLEEKEPGIYLGSISIDHGWNGTNMMLTGTLRDSSGVKSQYISPVGLINIDNKIPDPVTISTYRIDAHKAFIEWQHVEQNLNYKVYVVEQGQRKLLFESYQQEFDWSHATELFSTLHLAIVAIDQAGNISAETYFNKPVYPQPLMYNAEVLSQSRLPASLAGQFMMLRKYGPYIVDQKVVQAQGSNLFIEPGTVIEFTNTGNILVQGSVYSFARQPIQLKPFSEVLTAQTFLSLDSDEHVEIAGIEIDRAGIAIDVTKGKPFISDCRITNSQYSAIAAANNAQLNIERCVFEGSNTSGLVVTDQARIKVANSQFLQNFPFHIQSSSIYQLEASGNQWHPDASPMTILGNVRY